MFDRGEIFQSLGGVWQLALGRREGLDRFERTAGAFFRSFLAIFLVLPIYTADLVAERALILSTPERSTGSIDWTFFFAVKITSLVVDWFAFPVAMIFLARLLGLTARYGLYITVFNWSAVLLAAMLAPPFLLLGLGLIGTGAANLIALIMIVLALRIRWFVAVTALEIGGFAAAGLVALEFIMSVAIGRAAVLLIGI